MPLWTCEQCGAQFPESAEPPQACPVCEDERQYVNWKGQAWLTREELAKASQARLARRSRHSRHRRRAGFCDRAARALGARGRWLRDVGLCAAGHPGGHRLRPLARRPEGDRRFASALLWRGRRLERGVRRRAGLSAWRRSRSCHAAASGHRAMDRRQPSDIGRYPSGANRRTFRRRHGDALARGRGGPGRIAHRRCRDGGDGSPFAQLHVQFSELHSAQRRGGAPDLGGGRAAGVRPHLWRVVGPQHRRQCQGGVRDVRPAVYRERSPAESALAIFMGLLPPSHRWQYDAKQETGEA